jgi:hypothetical protein
MFWTIAFEILFLWVCYAAYMAVLVHRRGPVGGLFFYPQAMIDRVKALGMISEEEFRKRKRFAFTLLIAWMLVIPGIMILRINGARSWWDCCWQFYALFLGAEFFDWLFIDTVWVALSDWWLIPGTEDLNDTWHNVHVKQWKMLKLIPFSVPLAAAVGGLYWLIGRMM